MNKRKRKRVKFNPGLTANPPSNNWAQVYFVYFLIDMRSFDCLIGWQAHEGEVCSMQFSADETTAYSMGTDGKVYP